MPAVRSVVLSVAFAAALPLTAAPAAAQRLPFSRTFTVADGAALDASTIRGRIDVSVGAPGRVEVEGTVTVRVAGPADALDIARRLATNPPVEQDGATVRLRAPMSAVERRAVTVAYVVRVPAGMPVRVSSESGALRVAGVGGGAAIRTQSGAIDVLALAGPASVETGSGAVHADGVAGLLTVSTQSGGITAEGLRAGVTVSTQSGAVGLAMTGTGAATVATQSGGITVAVRPPLRGRSRPGRAASSWRSPAARPSNWTSKRGRVPWWRRTLRSPAPSASAM